MPNVLILFCIIILLLLLLNLCVWNICRQNYLNAKKLEFINCRIGMLEEDSIHIKVLVDHLHYYLVALPREEAEKKDEL